MLAEAIALAPRCIICSRLSGVAGSEVTQLECKHVVCAECLRVLRATDDYKYMCPIDMGVSSWIEVDTLLNQMTHALLNDDLKDIQQAVNVFKTHIYYWGVPCFEQERCEDPHCPYEHQRSPQSPCPDGRTCPRKERYCLFSHEGEFGNVEYSSLVGSSESNFSVERRDVSIPQNFGEGEEVILDSGDSDDVGSAIQSEDRDSTGRIYMKSQSIYKYLAKGQPSRLKGLLHRYNVQLQLVKRHHLRTKKSCVWRFGAGVQMKEFPQDIRAQLETAYLQNPSGIVNLDQRTVHFSPMVMLLLTHAYVPVHRELEYKTLTHAGCFQIEADPATYRAIKNEVKGLEKSIILPNWVNGDVVKKIVDECNLYIGKRHKLTGVKEDLLRAQAMLGQVRYPDKVTHMRLQPSICSDLVGQLAERYGLLLLNNLIIGREGDIYQLLYGDLSIPNLADLPPPVFLQRNHVRVENGIWHGQLEDITAVLKEMEEAAIPPLLGSYQHNEGLQFIGSKVSVAKAFAEQVPEAEKDKIYDVEIVEKFAPVTEEAWYLLANTPEYEAIPILPGSHDYQRIQARLLKERSPLLIERIQEIHNKKTFAAFLMRKEEVKREANEPIMELFYRDPRKQDPNLLAESAEGFNPLLYTGSWGTGLTFTKHVKQVLKTAYRQPDREYVLQVLLCQVLTGNSPHRNSDKNMVRPPKAPEGYFNHGVSGRGPVWTVYGGDMAYPRYLLTLSEPPPGI